MPRPRGRPKKGPPTPSHDDFDIVCAAIRGIPRGRRLAAAKAEARRIVGSDKRSSATAMQLFERIMDAINHTEGKDWHSAGFYARAGQCDRPKRTIERAIEELVDNGHIIRRRRKAAHGGWDASETTSPTLAKAGNATVHLGSDDGCLEEEEGTDEKDGTPTDQETGRVPTNNSVGYRPENREGTDEKDGTPTDQLVGLTSKINLQENLEENPSRACAREAGDDDFSFSRLKKAAARTAPRYDWKLPLAKRITTWPYAAPADQTDLALYRRMRRCAKGWDCDVLKGQFCEWMEGKSPPNDAMEAFLGWLSKTAVRRSPA